MKLLLDTNALLKWLLDEKIPRKAERLIQNPNSRRFVSIVTPWEIALKKALWHSKGLRTVRISGALDLFDARVLPILVKHIEVLESLPPHHGDPFDRMLIAQAISEDLTVVSSDERFPLYKSSGLKLAWD